MSDFGSSFPTILAHEGTIYTDDPLDHGGSTKFGLTLTFLQANVDKDFTVEELENMHVDQATSIYLHCFWNKYNLGSINNQALATKVFDVIVNLGINGGTRQIQKAINEVNIPVTIDGKLGPKTIACLNQSPTTILIKIRSCLVSFYEHIVQRDPSQGKFLKGWLNRANS